MEWCPRKMKFPVSVWYSSDYNWFKYLNISARTVSSDKLTDSGPFLQFVFNRFVIYLVMPSTESNLTCRRGVLWLLVFRDCCFLSFSSSVSGYKSVDVFTARDRGRKSTRRNRIWCCYLLDRQLLWTVGSTIRSGMRMWYFTLSHEDEWLCPITSLDL